MKPILHMDHLGMYLDKGWHVYLSMIWNGGIVEDPSGRGKEFRMRPKGLSLVIMIWEVVWFQIFHKEAIVNFQDVPDGE